MDCKSAGAASKDFKMSSYKMHAEEAELNGNVLINMKARFESSRYNRTNERSNTEYRLEADIVNASDSGYNPAKLSEFVLKGENSKTYECGATINRANKTLPVKSTIQLKTVVFRDGSSSGTPLSVSVFSDVSGNFTPLYENYQTKLGVNMSLGTDLTTTPVLCHDMIIVQLFTMNNKSISTQAIRCRDVEEALDLKFLFGQDKLPFSYTMQYDLGSLFEHLDSPQFSLLDYQDDAHFGAL